MADDVDAPLLRIDDEGAVRRLTLDRPGSANAFNRRLSEAFADAMQAAADDDGVSVVVLTGEGKVFSAGADLNDLARGSDAGSDTAGSAETGRGGAAVGSSSFGRGMNALIPAFAEFPKPLVAAVNGAAVGIGATMLLHCDAVLVSERARIRFPFTSMGISPEAASSLLLPRLVGRQQAARLLLTSEWVDAARAVELGLALAVSPHDALLDDAHAFAGEIAQHPLAALVATKRLLLAAERDAVDATIARENASFASLLAATDARDHLRGERARLDR
jgi:enoyl-CoA hydratase/carnithine racemase